MSIKIILVTAIIAALATPALAAQSTQPQRHSPNPAWDAYVGGKYVGTLSGSMNMIGNFGAAVGSLVVAYLLEVTGQNWSAGFYVGAAIYALGILCWLFLDAVTPLEQTDQSEDRQ